MHRSILMAAAAAACWFQPALGAEEAAERAAILVQVDRFFTAMAAQDVETYAALQLDDAMTYSQRYQPDGTILLRRKPTRIDIEELPRSPGMSERIWNPVVMIRGPMAVVWAPYEFRIDGEVRHCGIDSFDMLKVDGEWKMANAMWTVEPGACTELGAD